MEPTFTTEGSDVEGVTDYEWLITLPLTKYRIVKGDWSSFQVRAIVSHFGPGWEKLIGKPVALPWRVGLQTFGPPDFDLHYDDQAFATREQAEAFVVAETQDLLDHLTSPADLRSWYMEKVDLDPEEHELGLKERRLFESWSAYGYLHTNDKGEPIVADVDLTLPSSAELAEAIAEARGRFLRLYGLDDGEA